jgi:hypothetical protein
MNRRHLLKLLPTAAIGAWLWPKRSVATPVATVIESRHGVKVLRHYSSYNGQRVCDLQLNIRVTGEREAVRQYWTY